MDSLVSIIIPCFNAEAYVGEAIESALTQTYPNTEIIIVDDGSIDRSVDVIQSFGEQVRLEKIDHKGACAARNRGLQVSQGEFIQFLDADDCLVPSKVERQIPYLVSGEADLVFCKGYIFGDGRPLRPKKSEIKSPHGVDPFVYCLSQGLSTEGPLHRKKSLLKVKGFTEDLPRAQELDLHVRLGATGIKILLLDELLYEHRNHDNENRITRIKLQRDYMLSFFLQLEKKLMSQETYEMTEIRIQALSSVIFQHSIYAYRNGFREAAKTGFFVAKKLTNHYTYNERNWYKYLEKYFNPILLEDFLNLGRTFKKAFCIARKYFNYT